MPLQDKQKRLKDFITSFYCRAGAYELSILLASVVAAGGVWIFIEIADEVFEGETRRV